MSDRPVALTPSSPEQWRARHGRSARRATAAVLTLAVLLVVAMLVLPPASLLAGVVVLVLVVLALLTVSIRALTGTWRPWEHVGTMQRLLAMAGFLACTTCGGRYLISLAIEPESPRSSLLWGLPTAVLSAAFIAWATSPITPANQKRWGRAEPAVRTRRSR